MKRRVWRETPISVKLLLVTSFLMNLGFYALIPYLTLYLTGSIGWTVAMAGLVLGVRQFSQQGFAFLGGVVADTFGYKGTMVLGLLIRAAGFALFAFCTAPWQFFLAAVLSGLGGSLFEPAMSAAFAVLTPDSIRKDVFAFRNVLTNVGVVGSQVVGTALAAFDFTYLSLFAGAIFAGNGLIALFLLQPIEVKHERHGIWASMALVVRDRRFVRYTLILMGYYYLNMQLFLTIPQLAQDVTHSKTAVGIVLSSVSVSVILLQMKVSQWLEGYPQRLTLIGLGTFVMGFGLFLLAFADTLWMLVADALLFALGTMIAVPHMMDMVQRFAPPEHVGAYYGFNGYSLAIGGSVGQFAGGWVYDLAQRQEMPWLPWTLCLFVGLWVAWKLYRMEQEMAQSKSDCVRMARS
ncbi:MDR family MFS transporter [Brevibacillus aydinogluensis]|jgi:DHA1 family multidrug resistance protein-like MFS transporter|uniref:Arabinose ABC transporter permease n=1 Tax=Brevibacillus aydinogluensis TaxID=927786 RepID=A0AA48RHS4_9BACL|nr:MFS transporter [Brevibacillus aydinogluensis]CAJ1003062.1 Arabinose ABC transporter permease [Brevibacillus aydinogluensis]